MVDKVVVMIFYPVLTLEEKGGVTSGFCLFVLSFSETPSVFPFFFCRCVSNLSSEIVTIGNLKRHCYFYKM